MQPYSLDLRERVVKAYEQGNNSIAEISQMFNVGQTFVKKMLRLKRETGDLSPQPHGGGKPPSLLPKHLALLRTKVRLQNDISLVELQTHLQQYARISVHIATIGRALERLDLPRKKKHPGK
jgi:transposase